MHWLDRVSSFASARTPPEKRPFNLGWGDERIIGLYLEEVSEAPPVADIELVEQPARRFGRAIVKDVVFKSPFDRLPDPVWTARARWITTRPELQRIVILHAGWNDEDFETRTRLARLLLERGIASIMPEHPFYGDRRRSAELNIPIATVSDFCLMGRAAVLEGRSLARVLHDRGFTIGVSGDSMGGNIAGFVASTTDVPVAPTPIAAAYSPGPVFSDGILRHTIAWDALGGETDANVKRLGSIIDAASILDFPAPQHTQAAVLVAATNDGFVPSASTLALHRHWPGSKMEWVNAGHGSLLWRHRDRMAAAIVETFDRLDSLTAAGEH